MTIIDAQVHLWEADRPDRPWPAYGAAFAHGREMSAETMLATMDEAGVDRAVLVPPSWEGDRNEVCLDAAHHHPDRFAVMGRLTIDRPMAQGDLAEWLRQPGMRGVRLTFRQDFQHAWLTDGTAEWFWRLAEDMDIPVMVLAFGHLPEIRAVVERHPGLRLALDHLALSGVLEDTMLDHLAPVLDLARYPNVVAKATCLPNLTTEPYPFPLLQEVVRRTVDAFGPRRTFWGSDVSRLRCPLRDCVGLFAEACDFLDDDDRAWILGRGVAEWLGWTDAQAAF